MDSNRGAKSDSSRLKGGLLLVPLKSLQELRGGGKGNPRALLAGVRELEREHRREAKRSERKS